MRYLKVQALKLIRTHMHTNKLFERYGDTYSAQANKYRDLPSAYNTEKNFVYRVLDQCFGIAAQLWRIRCKPEETVCIEQ